VRARNPSFGLLPDPNDPQVLDLLRRNTELRERVLELSEELVQMKARLHQARAQIAAIAPTDEATGLMTFRELEARAQEEIARATRHERELSLVVFEVDAAEGDRARLRGLAELCRAQCRIGDLAARGDQGDVVVLLPETSVEGARVMASRILAQGAGGSARAGCAGWPRDGRSLAQVLAAARRALRAAGRDPGAPGLAA
jgi:GGDEF domain-containing protein